MRRMWWVQFSVILLFQLVVGYKNSPGTGSHGLFPGNKLSNVRNEDIIKMFAQKFTGKVKFFDTVKGFGFISPADGTEDIFVHQSNIHARGFRSLAEGEPVEFEVMDDVAKNKKYAINVTGPNGDFVLGAPRPERASSRGAPNRMYGNSNNNDYGMGGMGGNGGMGGQQGGPWDGGNPY